MISSHQHERVLFLLRGARRLGTISASCAIIGTSFGFLPFLLTIDLSAKIVLAVLGAGLLITSVALYRNATMGVAILLADIIRNMSAVEAQRLMRALRENVPPVDPDDRA